MQISYKINTKKLFDVDIFNIIHGRYIMKLCYIEEK